MNKEDLTAVFALSTGRCGTTTLAALLDLSPDIVAVHEPDPKLMYESKLAYERHPCAREIFAACRIDAINEVVFRQKLTYAETAPRSTFFAYDIELFTAHTSKYIHLIRPMEDVVRSKVARGAYAGHSWDIGRITPQDKILKEKWETMTQVEKNVWNWKETNRWIMAFMGSIHPDRSFTLPFEKMIDPDSGVMLELFEWLGVEQPKYSEVRSVLSKDMNANSPERRAKYKEIEV